MLRKENQNHRAENNKRLEAEVIHKECIIVGYVARCSTTKEQEISMKQDAEKHIKDTNALNAATTSTLENSWKDIMMNVLY